MKKKYVRNYFDYLILVCIFCMFALFTSCSHPDDDSIIAGGGTPAGGAGAGSITLSLSQGTVQSDGSDSTSITTAVMDTNNVPMDGVRVDFSTTAGAISSASCFTDINGLCQISFSAGTEQVNQTVQITATVAGLTPGQVPVQITGSTVDLSSDRTDLEIGGSDTAILTIRPLDASLNSIANTAVTVSVDPVSTGTVILTPPTGTTDFSGELQVTVQGTSTGDVTLRVDAAGATATQAYTIGTLVSIFAITSPTQNLVSLDTNTNLTITVNAPGVSDVIFATTTGAWDGGAQSVIVKPVAGGVVSATFRSSLAAVAMVEVYDLNNPLTSKDSLQVVVAAPPSQAAQLSLQASSTVVAPSTGGVVNTVTLRATVKTASPNEQPVANAPVAFSILNPTGGGETISPVIAYTDSSGTATTTFSSGTLPSTPLGVDVEAIVVSTAISDTLPIVIGGQAASLVIGRASKVQSISNNTAYLLPMSVLVSDSNGNMVEGAVITLKAWPSNYSTGSWVLKVCTHTSPPGGWPNEDANMNIILDPGEDAFPNLDGLLTPPSSAAGNVPGTVVTDEYGVAVFDLVYLKQSACWIEDKITATTLVSGSETTSTIDFWLPWLKGEEDSLPHSPYGP